MSELAALFPAGDYRFHLTLRRGEPKDFFGPQDPSGHVLQERGRWLAENPARYAALRPAGEPLLAEAAELGEKVWGLPRVTSVGELGARWEPDVLLLSPDTAGALCLQGGALCFPTGWALEEKIGHPLDFIHGTVPGLNVALAPSIHQFLTRLKPGMAFYRDNWGIVATDQLNLHPARALPVPALPVDLAKLWLRVEYQALLALPRTRGIVFGIRIALHRLDAVARDAAAAAGLRHALSTMPSEMTAYKRLAGIKTELIGAL